jgi:hypothetical protein
VSEAIIVQYDADRYGMSLKCDKCDFALLQNNLPEQLLKDIEAMLVKLLPLRHTCPAIKGEQK